MPRMLPYFIIRVSSRWERKQNSLREKKRVRESETWPNVRNIRNIDGKKKRKGKKIACQFYEKNHHLRDDTI